MILAQRRAHAWTWALLALVLGLALIWALTLRATRPIEPVPEAIRQVRGAR